MNIDKEIESLVAFESSVEKIARRHQELRSDQTTSVDYANERIVDALSKLSALGKAIGSSRPINIAQSRQHYTNDEEIIIFSDGVVKERVFLWSDGWTFAFFLASVIFLVFSIAVLIVPIITIAVTVFFAASYVLFRYGVNNVIVLREFSAERRIRKNKREGASIELADFLEDAAETLEFDAHNSDYAQFETPTLYLVQFSMKRVRESNKRTRMLGS